MATTVLKNATDNLNYIEGLIKQTPDPQQERPLADCAELYIPVVKYELPQAIEALSRGHFGFAKYNIADVGKQADNCEKGFSGSSAKSPLTDRNKLDFTCLSLSRLCGIGPVGVLFPSKRTWKLAHVRGNHVKACVFWTSAFKRAQAGLNSKKLSHKS
ncbi:hypothetical protein EZV62_000139 [Acer yangbiense]|uniref:Pectinesterase inhibitor domain-containing protein n=1 Tax=Acer yangbiense TaxID=1000413 RepID=A0A5C7IQG9_9ROSI|nr:hypothetical protein EZV62_000139 [Acer yangbiense]